MQGGGFRGPGIGGGGGGGFHHHHHHHGGGLMAGMMVGAAMASRRHRGPDVIVVQQGGGGNATTTTTTTGGGAYYTQQQQHVVVAPSAAEKLAKKVRTARCAIACVFILTIILCASLIAWPSSQNVEVILGSQQLHQTTGLFMEQVRTTASGSVVVYAFADHEPDRGRVRSFETGFDDVVARFQYVYMRFDLLEESTVNVVWHYYIHYYSVVDSCSLDFIILEGEDSYHKYSNGQDYSDYYSQPITSDGTYTFHALHDDSYYFVFENSYCTSNVVINASFAADVVAYSNSSAIQTCTDQTCSIDVDYGQKLYYVLEAPTTKDENESFSVTIETTGRWYCYTFLYVGLVGGMLACCGLVTAVQKRKAREAEEEHAPLLRQRGVPVSVNSSLDVPEPPPYEAPPYSEATPYVAEGASSASAPSTAPYPEVSAFPQPQTNSEKPKYRFDPMTGQPLQ